MITHIQWSVYSKTTISHVEAMDLTQRTRPDHYIEDFRLYDGTKFGMGFRAEWISKQYELHDERKT